MATVKVLVGGERNREGRFVGFWAEFEGEEVDSYKDERGDNNVVYTLYKSTAYTYHAYLVHKADETDHQNPVYQLLPSPPGSRAMGARSAEPYDVDGLAQDFPLFLRHTDYFDTRRVDPR